jgi:TolA-binding protein
MSVNKNLILAHIYFFPQNAQLEKQYSEVLRELETKDTDHMMECTQLREEISKLRTEMEGILTELQTLMDAKLSLELEICAYRKLLEGEENRSVRRIEEKTVIRDRPVEIKDTAKEEPKDNPKKESEDADKEAK